MIGQSLQTGTLLARISVGLTVALCAAAAQAQVPPAAVPQEGAPPVSEIVITAQKRSQRLEEVPISVKAITSETLETINAQSAEDYLRSVPSVSMTNLARGGNQIQIRGLGSNVGNVGTVAIYNDGVISPGRIQQSGTFAEEDPALFDVDRIEVLRGPQGTLYGEGSFGGVINIISKRPNPERFETAVSASWFSRAHGSADNQDFAGMVNIPLQKDTFALRAVGYSYNHDGWIEQVGPTTFAEPLRVLNKNANTEDVKGGRLLARFAPGDAFDATLILKSEKQHTGALPIVSPGVIDFINGLAGTDFDPQYSQPDYFGSANRSKTDQAVLELNVDTPIGRLTSVGGYGEVDGNGSSGVVRKNQAWNEELRLASDLDPQSPVSWIVGGYYRSAKSDIDFTGIPIAENEAKAAAIFGQAYWRFAPQWNATLGLRYEHQKSDVLDQLAGLDSNAKFHSTVPKLAIDYQRDDHSLYYASVAKGFRGGGANIDESFGSDPIYRAPFDPDEIWNYEIGAKVGFLDRKLTVNAAVFYIDWKDIQIDQPIGSLINPPVAFIVVNGENAHSYGIEADIYLNPTPRWSITAGGSWVNAEFDSGAINDFPDITVPLNGQKLPSTPRYTASLSVERSFALGNVSEGYLRGDYTLRASSFGDVPNQPPPGGLLASGASRITNLRAGVRAKGWDVQVFCTNLFDARDSTFTFYDGGFVDQRVLLPPRTLGVNVRFRYD